MNTADIIHAFTHNPPGIFPEKELQAAIKNQQDIIPELLNLLRKGAEDITALAGTKDDNGFLYAMFLLAQFKEEKGLQPLIDFFCTEGMTAIMLTGDVVTENLNKLFGGMAQNNITPLTTLIEDRTKNSFVRAAAMEALLSLIAWGNLQINTVEDYFLELLTVKLEKEPSHVWDYLSDAAGRIGTQKLTEPLEVAYKENLASNTYIPWETTQKLLLRSSAENMADLQDDQGLSPITNVIEEMQGWACFTPKDERIAPIKIPKQQQPVQTGQKIGRNEPCPCGSGKKFKKCCG
jgi:hypothetical protein